MINILSIICTRRVRGMLDVDVQIGGILQILYCNFLELVTINYRKEHEVGYHNFNRIGNGIFR